MKLDDILSLLTEEHGDYKFGLTPDINGTFGIELTDVEFDIASIGRKKTYTTVDVAAVIEVNNGKITNVVNVGISYRGAYMDASCMDSDSFSWANVLEEILSSWVIGDDLDLMDPASIKISKAKDAPKYDMYARYLPITISHGHNEVEGEFEFEYEGGEASSYDYQGSPESFGHSTDIIMGKHCITMEFSLDIDGNDLADHYFDGP